MHQYLSVIVTALCFLFACGISKPPITVVPEIDKNTPIYYWDKKNWVLIHLEDRSEINRVPVEKMTSDTRLSPSAEYLLSVEYDYHYDNLDDDPLDVTIENKPIKKKKNATLLVGELKTRKVTLEIPMTLPERRYDVEESDVNWSLSKDVFYIMHEDTIFSVRPSGDKEALYQIEDLKNFALSRQDNQILFFHKDSLEIYNLKTREKTGIYQVGNILGEHHIARSLCWAPGDKYAAFVVGWRMYFYHLASGELTEFKANSEVFEISWVDNNTIIFVEGDYPDENQKYNQGASFKLVKLTLSTLESIYIHSRLSDNPISMEPRISPSGKLILFSESKLNGGLQVKLMTLDGTKMTTLKDGIYPAWYPQNFDE